MDMPTIVTEAQADVYGYAHHYHRGTGWCEVDEFA